MRKSRDEIRQGMTEANRDDRYKTSRPLSKLFTQQPSYEEEIIAANEPDKTAKIMTAVGVVDNVRKIVIGFFRH